LRRNYGTFGPLTDAQWAHLVAHSCVVDASSDGNGNANVLRTDGGWMGWHSRGAGLCLLRKVRSSALPLGLRSARRSDGYVPVAPSLCEFNPNPSSHPHVPLSRLPVNSTVEVKDVDLSALWPPATMPTLLLRGAESDLLLEETAQAMVSSKPEGQVTLVQFPGVGHAPALLSDDQIEPLVQWIEAHV